jgi:hypothetical protein
MATGAGSDRGSAGQRGAFVYNRSAWAACLAGGMRVGDFTGFQPRLFPRRRLASFTAASPIHISSRMGMASELGLYHKFVAGDAPGVAREIERWFRNLADERTLCLPPLLLRAVTDLRGSEETMDKFRFVVSRLSSHQEPVGIA